MNAVAIAVHVLAAVIWVGGMFFAYIVLRPTLASLEAKTEQGPVRLQVWAGAFRRFFPWVWCAIVLLLVTGFFLVFNVYRGLATTPTHVHIMIFLAFLMIALFLLLYYGPYRRFKSATGSADWPAAAAAMNGIRQIVLGNLILGIAVVLVASGGRFLSIIT